MKSIKRKLSGVFTPVVTPFKDDKLILEYLSENLQKLNSTDLTGYLALGSNGEFRSLTDEEQIKVLDIFAREKGEKVVMAGTACESTIETIEKTKKVADMGCDFASILTPGYFAKRMNDEILTGYYQRIADSSPIPILLYNAPGFAGGVQISPKAVKELARHENIVGMKDSSPTGPNRFLAQLDTKQDFYVLAGSANFFYPSLHLGAVGGILSLANVLPEQCCKLYQLFLERAYDEARELHFRLQRLNGAVSGTYGVAGVKGAMEVTGFKGGEPRHPLTQITEADKEEIRKKIIAEGFAID
ncbi:MAG TPA: dihydrodipicolinate synthase family protein [Anaerolineae bacterium]|nr:dihydrodipicolinate synthase family protein [Anaerolineae bacterium]